MTKAEFLELTFEEKENLVKLKGEKAEYDKFCFRDEDLTDEEYFEIATSLYLKQAIEDGVVTE